MSANDDKMQELTTELQKFRATFGDVMKDTKESRVTLQNIAQILKNTQDIAQQTADEQVTAPDVENLDDDMRKALDFHNKVADGIKQSQEEEESAGEERDKKRSQDEIRDIQKKNAQAQMTTNEYLQALTNLTEKNNAEIRKQKETRRGPLSLVGGAYGSVEDAFYRARDFGNRFAEDPRVSGGGAKVTGGIGETLTGFRKIGSALKKPFEALKGRGSKKRQGEIDKLTKDINKEKALLSAEFDTLNMGDRSKTSGKRDAFRKQIATMRERRDRIRSQGQRFGDVVSDEYLYQKGRSDKSFRNLSDYERNLLAGQSSRNIAKSITSDIGGMGRRGDVGSRLKNMQEPDTRRGMFGDSSLMDRMKQKVPFGQRSSQLGTTPASTPSRTKQKKETARTFNTPLKTSTNPRTYGEYIAGIYNEMEGLNKTLNQNAKKAASINQGDDGGSSLFGGLIGSIGGMLLGAIGGKLMKGMKGLFKMAGKGGAKVLGKAGSKTGIKFLEKFGMKAGEKALAKGGAKGVGKTLAKGGGKMLGKKIPFLGLGLGLGFAADRFSEGDILGGLGEILSGALSIIPGLGTAASFGVDALLVGRDLKKAQDAEQEQQSAMDNWLNPDKAGGAVGKAGYEVGNKIIGSGRKATQMRDQLRQRQVQMNDQYSSDMRLQSQRMKVNTTMNAVGSASTHERMSEMQVQARLIALEMKKVYNDPAYIDQQKSVAMVQGKAVSEATFG